MNAFLLLLALLGHAFLWIGLVNRLHAMGIRRRIIKSLSLVFFLCSVLILVGGWQYCGNDGVFVRLYVILCWMVLAATLFRLVYFRWIRQVPSIVRYHGRRRVEINPDSAEAGESSHHFITRLPRNEILHLEVTQWDLDVPRLPPALNGLSVIHLSDLHLTGRVGVTYFREVVRTCNELRPDLVCITGDIVDHPMCIEWIADTLGKLDARHGVYFILGNHDRLVDFQRLRQTMQQSGFVDLGGRLLSIEIHGAPILLAGNERPWINTPLVQDTHQFLTGHRALRIALAHTSDQLAWAQAFDADLMLSGHTHGGQICIPPLGAIFSPMLTGVKYISGVFHAPPTILHVTRGLSGDIPVRWNCRPEIALLKLRAGR
jgi:uncharacterized protein